MKLLSVSSALDADARLPRWGGVVLLALVFTVVCGARAPDLWAAEPAAVSDSFARCMSPSTIAYVECAQPEPLLKFALDPAWEEKLADLEGFRQAQDNRGFQNLKDVVGRIEGRLGVEWREILQRTSGAALGIDALNQGVLLVVRANEASDLAALHTTAIELIEEHARNLGRETPIETVENAGVTTVAIDDKIAYAIVDDTLLLTNKPASLAAAIARHQGKSSATLLKVGEFQKARNMAAQSGHPQAWGMVRLAALKLLPQVGEALRGPRDNPAAEYLAGGVFEGLRRADVACLSLDVVDGRLRSRFLTPIDLSQVAERRSWHFPEDANRGAAPLLDLPNTLFSGSIYRDLAGMWQQRDELFTEEIVLRMAQVDSQLGLYFGGQDFSADVLAQLTPRMRLVVARHEFAAESPVPAIRLPAFATIVEMKEPDAFAEKLLVGYQKLIGILNIVGTMEGHPSLLMDSQQHAGVKIHTARYLADRDIPQGEAKINYNFSPSCARVGRYFINGSTTAIVQQCIDALQKTSDDADSSDNLRWRLNLVEVAQVLRQNQEFLIARNMLEQGQSRADAEGKFQQLLELLQQMQTSTGEVSIAADTLKVEASIGLPKP